MSPLQVTWLLALEALLSTVAPTAAWPQATGAGRSLHVSSI